MKYILLIHDDPAVWAKFSESERTNIMGEYGRFSEEIRSGGHFVGGAQLQPTTAATSVRVRDGKRLVVDGPFAETREQLGGYYLVDVPNLDQAIAIAARIPSARFGTVEVRPLVERPASV